MPIISIDGVDYEVEEGRTILQALDDLGVLMNGVEIPHYCWHPKLSVDGSCRLCQVEVEGIPKLQIACDTPVKDGMVISTKSDRVKRAREGVMELLLVNHPLDCPICDQAGECKLQDYAYEYGVRHSRSKEPRRAAKKRVDFGPTITFDQERCILCRRCVRFCQEVPGTAELGTFGRGDQTKLDTFPGIDLDNDYSMNVADICPVGALTTKDFRFKIRTWFLDEIPGVCTGCANGCNIYLGVANNKVYRYVPRRNDAVNQTWICDAGRMSYKEIEATDRLTGVSLRGESGTLEPTTLEQGIRAGGGATATGGGCQGSGRDRRLRLGPRHQRGSLHLQEAPLRPRHRSRRGSRRDGRGRRPARQGREGRQRHRSPGSRLRRPRPRPRTSSGRRCRRRDRARPRPARPGLPGRHRGARQARYGDPPRHQPLGSRAGGSRGLPDPARGREERDPHQPRRAGAADRAGRRAPLRELRRRRGA